jgi:arylsulfatase A-like enzyme
MPMEKVLLPQALQNAGYVTGMFGKWQLGSDQSHHPSRRGFDDAIVSAGKHFDFETHPSVDVPKGTYLADFLTDRALEFIQVHRKDRFFLYLPHFGVHAPHQAKEERIAHFREKAPDGGHHDPVYAAMIASVDESVGRIVDLLAKLQLDQNTVVIFSSDNGGLGGFPPEGTGKGENVTDNAPLRSGKGSLYEGGIRVPFIWKWPGRIAPGVCSTPITSVDLYPSFLELAGAPRPTRFPLDGTSIVPLLRGESIQRDALYWHFPVYVGGEEKAAPFGPAGAIRSGPWKLVEHFEDGRVELYNLQEDIGEKRSVTEENPSVAKDLLGRLREWRKATSARMPVPNN